jgi:hypothetical protein
MGAGGKLEAAAPQLLGTDKMEAGKHLIQLFSIPGKYQELGEHPWFDDAVVAAAPDEWEKFRDYCELDAELSLRLVLLGMSWLPDHEYAYAAITQDMNVEGWHVDVALVEEMQRRYLENQEQALVDFRDHFNEPDLNLNSLKQMKEWCAERGVKATSFNEKNVAKLIGRIDEKLDSIVGNAYQGGRYDDYLAVRRLLETKQILGGSSLKKLQVILDTVGRDGRLRDQYLHIGAGQSWRTTGRSVQMQNLKRLAEPGDTDELYDDDTIWDNEKLAANIRQAFTSRHPGGALIVGDFSSVESRGLAWLAGADWKLAAFATGQDMYKVLATKIYPGTSYDQVTKAQRQTGKVGELSCGYQAGGGAVQMFAENMGVQMSEGEANQLVNDWRLANLEVVELWLDLDAALNSVLENGIHARVLVGPGKDYVLRVECIGTPESLVNQHPGAQSISMSLFGTSGELLLVRYFHGCYRRGKNICYYKPSQLKTGDLWSSHFTDPKTKQVRFYTIYGGKLAGILTQSFCREIFFRCLATVKRTVSQFDNLHLVGQFHDEIVLDWTPELCSGNSISKVSAVAMLKGHMSDNGGILGFPLIGDVHDAYRYIK